MNQRHRFLATLEMTVIQNFLNPPVLLLQHFIIPSHLYNPSSPHKYLVIPAHLPVIPAQAGIQNNHRAPRLDSRLRGNDGEKSGASIAGDFQRWQVVDDLHRFQVHRHHTQK
ncbi:hypothetical protein SAMN05216333_101100 [Nitrosomonas oligotropha]|uniref:Uncharacterized protein n=1 Tax=Nitrosomonas oligotropha TaxID=42354 RepID=A0A1H8J5G2_9PROT|nr:hypothetical protein SAMN05216300_101200 [Nitrosomonas oligotropha]SEN75831.1 hypothetical protein SAMN05216333_101100 [Nitrosomonas oligotropha]